MKCPLALLLASMLLLLPTLGFADEAPPSDDFSLTVSGYRGVELSTMASPAEGEVTFCLMAPKESTAIHGPRADGSVRDTYQFTLTQSVNAPKRAPRVVAAAGWFAEVRFATDGLSVIVRPNVDRVTLLPGEKTCFSVHDVEVSPDAGLGFGGTNRRATPRHSR